MNMCVLYQLGMCTAHALYTCFSVALCQVMYVSIAGCLYIQVCIYKHSIIIQQLSFTCFIDPLVQGSKLYNRSKHTYP